ncbi:MAG: prepilin-type N-terminal cleavage/methylation domain-containing protein [bacterium]
MSRTLERKNTQSGFTLIEIMVVLVILGALAIISVPVYSNYVNRAKINEAISNVDALANAIRIYKMENGRWPTKDTLTKDDTTGGTVKVVDINETYFDITWSVPAPTATLIMNITPKTTSGLSGNGLIIYEISPEYRGTWKQNPANNGLLTKYAPYLLNTAS